MQLIIRPVVTILFIAVFFLTDVRAVENASRGTQFWTFQSTGITTLGTGTSLGIGVDYNRHIFSLRSSATDLRPFQDTWDIGLLYGRSIEVNDYYISGAAGFGMIAGEQYSKIHGGTAEGSMDNMISFPVEGHFSRVLTNHLALGLYTYLNINTNQPFGGFGAAIRIGKFN